MNKLNAGINFGNALHKLNHAKKYAALFNRETCVLIEAASEIQAEAKAKIWASERGVKWTILQVNEVTDSI